MVSVSSSAITDIEWDEDTQTLTVTFRDGSSYDYTGVSEEEYNDFLNAGSIGAYFNANIR
jgi:hypothetical protein